MAGMATDESFNSKNVSFRLYEMKLLHIFDAICQLFVWVLRQVVDWANCMNNVLDPALSQLSTAGDGYLTRFQLTMTLQKCFFALSFEP